MRLSTNTGKVIAKSAAVAESATKVVARSVLTILREALTQVNHTLRTLAGDDQFMFRFYQAMLAVTVLAIGGAIIFMLFAILTGP